MKTRPERHNALFALAVVLIAASLGAYGLLVKKWLGGRPAAAPFSPRSPDPAPEDLALARARFREQFLDPAVRLRLAQALYAKGRLVDAFYVILEARRFFDEDAFNRAHARVVLRKDSLRAEPDGDPDTLEPAKLDELLAARPADPELQRIKADRTAKSDLMAAIPLYARLANSAPGTYDARRALEALSKAAAKRDSDPQIEAGRLAQEALEELSKAQPKEPLVFASLATAAWNRGDTGAARARAAEALRHNPVNAGALMADGMIALSDGNTEKAFSQFSAAWELNPDDLYSAGQLARLNDRERGDREAALPYYIALYRADPAGPAAEGVEQQITEILDARRKALVGRVNVESLSRFFSSDDGSLRAEACARAAQAKDPRWVDSLAELLDDDVDIVRHNADYALYQIAFASPDAVKQRKEEWLSSPRPLLRTRALNLFADLYDKETFPAVVTALSDPSPTVRFLTKTMVLDHYYKDAPAAAEIRRKYSATEKDPAVLALYARMGKS